MGLIKLIKDRNRRIREEAALQEQLALDEYNENIRLMTELPLQDFLVQHLQYNQDILLKKNEDLYFTLGVLETDEPIYWYEERTRTERVGYSGVTTNVRIMKGVSYRAGTVKPIKNTITENKIIRTGPLYLTNKRLIMLSDTKPGTIRLSSVVNIIPYSDGVCIQKDSGKDVVLTGFNGELFTILMKRMITEDLSPSNTSPIQTHQETNDVDVELDQSIGFTVTYNENKGQPIKPLDLPDHQLRPETEKVLTGIKVDFDSRYKPSEYNVDPTIPSNPTSGVVVLLWWLTKNDIRTSHVPSYFYFKYGVTADQLIRIANIDGYMNELEISEAGRAHLEANDDIIDEHRGNPKKTTKKAKELANAYTSSRIDFDKITSKKFDDLSDGDFKRAQDLMLTAAELTKQKRYSDSISAVLECLALGYQIPGVWNRAAINARCMKDLKLEEHILRLGIQQSLVDFDEEDEKLVKRLNRVLELQNK
ncbi:hypothetical protein OIT44_03975 [Weissella ceti]|uniref:Uncharacterized protein n=1 Tax=Weissella ceti TaxID=759620 RepID=A0ABT3E4B2_9LACO|nr:hypothetical protein [Weissella ceti]MCW0953232.1 hypothetical protein [Weissella ceti]QVK12748.1 hypothetical protein KHQ31_03735 [Weissella ceti]